MPQEPMILVRKPDGTKVKMTLAEFRASKQKQTSARVPAGTVLPESAMLRPVTQGAHVPTEKTWDMDDHRSLMETEAHDEMKMPLVTPSSLSAEKKSVIPQGRQSSSTTQPMSPIESPRLNTTVPRAESAVNPRSAKPVPEELSRLIESARERPIIQDIRATERTQVRPAKKSMGPVDELGAMTLTDLHRLGNTADMIQQTLIQKFETLKTDAFIAYLDAVHAWEMSPLYKAYVAILEEALKNRQSIVEYTDAHKGEGVLTAEDVSIVYAVSARVRL